MENADQLVGLTQYEQQSWTIFCPSFPFDKPRPAAGFAQFFQADFHFVNEIIARFGGFSFAMVGIWRSAGTQNLSGDVIARPGIWKHFRQVNDCRCKFQQPVFKIKFSLSARAFVEFPNYRLRILQH